MEIVALQMGDGDPGYFAKGHVDRAEFVAEVNRQFEEEFEDAEAQHVYQTETIPDRFKGRFDKPSEYDGLPYWWICKPDDPGAFPVTFIRP